MPRQVAHPLSVSFGWSESSEADGDYKDQWDEILDSLAAEVNPTGIDLTVGRADWSLTPHPGEAKDDLVRHSSSTVGRDRFSPVMQKAKDRGINQHRITIDTMSTDTLKQYTEERSVSADGTVRTSLPSAYGLTEGHTGDLIEDHIKAVVKAWPDINAIVLTELHWDDGSFSDLDLELFKYDTGMDDWPRDDRGRPDITNPDILDWLTTRMQMFVERLRIAAGRVPLIADVRVNWDDPTAGRPESGQDYDKLLQVADALQGWTFYNPGDGADALLWANEVEAEWPGRVSSSVMVRDNTDLEELKSTIGVLRNNDSGTQFFPYQKYADVVAAGIAPEPAV